MPGFQHQPICYFSRSAALSQKGDKARAKAMMAYIHSLTANSSCAKAIKDGLMENFDFHLWRLNTAALTRNLLAEFGRERVLYVLANTILRGKNDAFSSENREWASTVRLADDEDALSYLVKDVNLSLVDLLTTEVRSCGQIGPLTEKQK